MPILLVLPLAMNPIYDAAAVFYAFGNVLNPGAENGGALDP